MLFDMVTSKTLIICANKLHYIVLTTGGMYVYMAGTIAGGGVKDMDT